MHNLHSRTRDRSSRLGALARFELQQFQPSVSAGLLNRAAYPSMKILETRLERKEGQCSHVPIKYTCINEAPTPMPCDAYKQNSLLLCHIAHSYSAEAKAAKV